MNRLTINRNPSDETVRVIGRVDRIVEHAPRQLELVSLDAGAHRYTFKRERIYELIDGKVASDANGDLYIVTDGLVSILSRYLNSNSGLDH